MRKFLEKNKKRIIVLLAILILIVVAVLIYNYAKKNKINVVTTVNYSVKYDDTWEVDKQEDMEINLIHKKSKSSLNFKLSELQEEKQYSTIEEIFDSLIYNIQEQNPDYKLIYKEPAKITKQNIDGYKMLFETNDRQAMISTYRYEDKLVIITYEATYEYFDILIDNANSIINNFNLNEENFNLETGINIETQEIKYSEQHEVSDLLKDTKQEEIAENNYLVKYSIPSNFKLTEYNTQLGHYEFQGVEDLGTISLNTSILPRSIFECLDKDESKNIFLNYNLDSYENVEEQLNKYEDENLAYIYRNKYTSNGIDTENIELIFELDKNHIFVAAISAMDLGIPKELVNMIKINESKNIASNIDIVKENGYLIGKLKKYSDYTYENTQEITLKLPENYEEVDKLNNLYAERNYTVEYNDELGIGKYDVAYRLTTISDINSEIEQLNEEINTGLGKFENCKQLQDITVNDKNFKVYERGRTQLSNSTDSSGNRYKYYTNEKILFYELPNNNYLIIIIGGNENQVTEEQIELLTNFDVN